jgi:hypothetical protein
MSNTNEFGFKLIKRGVNLADVEYVVTRDGVAREGSYEGFNMAKLTWLVSMYEKDGYKITYCTE